MMNLKEMTVTQAVRTAKEASGKTGKEIADSVGISRGVLTRYLKADDDYSPRMGMIPDLCDAFENDILLQWLEVRIREDRNIRREKMLLHVGKVKKALEEATLILSAEEEMAAEDEEELHDLINFPGPFAHSVPNLHSCIDTVCKNARETVQNRAPR